MGDLTDNTIVTICQKKSDVVVFRIVNVLRRFAGCLAGFALACALTPVLAQTCAGAGEDGPANTLTGTVNTYYPGVSNPNSTTINVGTARGAAATLAAGDLVLVIQMQDGVNAANFGNTAAYGATAGTAGRHEYALVSGFAANTITLFRPLLYTYTNAQGANTVRQTFQVVRVPQYSTATVPGANTVTPATWDGTTGGIVALDVAGTFTLNGTINVSGYGFRGGAGRIFGGGGTNTSADYRYQSNNTNGATRGEGTAGSPRNTYMSIGPVYTWSAGNGTNDLYPNGDHGYGAAGNAGGGGNDGAPGNNSQNSGGGGGSGAGAGGQGGNTWNSNLNVGGRGGYAIAPSAAPAATRAVLGGGGGAGASNNGSSDQSFSGGSGGGIVMVRAGAFAGAGTVNAAGFNGTPPTSACCDDGGTGGGGGGTVVLLGANSAGLAGITVNAGGGNGSPTPTGSVNHGPGGGGGGGAILTSGPVAGASSVAGGARGAATWNAADGSAGVVGTTYAIDDTGLGASSGSSCRPSLTVTKITTTPTRTLPAQTTAQYQIVIANAAGGAVAFGVAATDALPTPFLLSGTTAAAALSSALGPAAPAATGTTNVQIGTPGGTVANSFVIMPGGVVTLTFTVSLDSAVPGTYQNPAATQFLDPTRTAAGTVVSPGGTYTAGGTVGGSNYDAASSTGEDVTVAGASSSVTSAATMCPASTLEITSTNLIANSDFSNTAASPGNAGGVVLGAVNSDVANNGVAYQTGLQNFTANAPDLYQGPFPGDAARSVAGSNYWLLANGNTLASGAGIWWSQTVSGLVVGQTYTFLVYASSPTDGAQTSIPTLRLQVTQTAVVNHTLGAIVADTAAADVWHLYQATFLATQATATLAINNTVTSTALERRGQFAIAQPTLRRCSPLVNLSITKTDGTTTIAAGSITTYTIVVTNGGPNPAPGATVTDTAAPGLNCTTVACSSSAANMCPSASFPFSDLVSGIQIAPNFNSGQSATLTVTCGVTATGL